MTRRPYIPLAVTALAFSSPLFAGAPIGTSARIDDRAIVRLRNKVDINAFIAAFESDHPGIDLIVSDDVASRRIYLLAIDAPDGTNFDAIENDLASNYTVQLRWGELLYENDAPEGSTGSTYVDRPVAAAMYPNQYINDLLGLPSAHLASQGQGIIVAVLDTGVDSGHPLMTHRLAPGSADFVGGARATTDTGDLTDNDGDGSIDEMVGHGTFVAGLVATVAPQARILPIRVLNSDGVGDGWTLAKGMFHAIDHGAHVINVSLRSTYNTAAVEDAAEEAKTKGIVVVAAAANFDREEPEEFPAMAQSKVLGVAATDDLDIKADFSNYNDKLFISAPGTTAFIGDEPDWSRAIISGIPGGGFAAWEGTSMATPLVAGAVALIRAQHPEWLANELTFDAVESILASTAENINAENPGYHGLLGVGRLDVAAAVAEGPAVPEPCPADCAPASGDGLVSIGDVLAVVRAYGSPGSVCDIEPPGGDGVITVADVLAVVTAYNGCQ